MNKQKVLLITHDQDGTGQLLAKSLEKIGQPYHVIDLSTFPNKATATIDYNSNLASVSFSCPSGSFRSHEVKSVWWRRPRGKITPQTSSPIGKYIALESEIFINSLFRLLKNSRWVSDPDNTRIANSKPLQLSLAKEIGFNIPNTIISNDPAVVKDFILSNNVPLTMKPVGSSYVRVSDDENFESENLAIFTRVIDKNQFLSHLDLVKNCPIILQEAIVDKIDLRITVVDDICFPVSIVHTADHGAGDSNLDWRNHKLNRIYSMCEIPDSLKKMCVNLTRQLGLNFGAIDMCFSEEKGYYFFEINPQGQWVPSEVLAGHPISSALANYLSK